VTVAGTDWVVERVVSITDGDTVRLVRRRSEVIDGLGVDHYDTEPKGIAIRLVTLDTPERGEPGHDKAKQDVIDWLTFWRGELRIETWPGGGFDRLLGDIYAGDRGNTLSQHMLRDKGWLPYVKGA
jgi:endonuclease YncB( thermonuclease family)